MELPAEISCDTISYSIASGFIVFAENGDIQFSGECALEQLADSIGQDTAAALLKSEYRPDWCRLIGRFRVNPPLTSNHQTYLAKHHSRQQYENSRLENLLTRAAEQTASLRQLYGQIAELLDNESVKTNEICNAQLAFLRAQTALQLDSNGGVRPITPQCVATLRANWATFRP